MQGGAAATTEAQLTGKPEEHQQRAIEADKVLVVEAADLLSEAGSGHCRHLVHHQSACFSEAGDIRRLHSDPKQRGVNIAGGERHDCDRRGGVESVVLYDRYRAGLPGIGPAGRGYEYVASPHDYGESSQSTEMASTNAWSSRSCSSAATSAD